MIQMNQMDIIKGLTTNPTLMKKSGINNYKNFCIDILSYIKTKPVSFEVFSDSFDEMEYQALEISSWAENVYVKIPITNTKGEGCYELINRLIHKKIKINITAIMTLNQVDRVSEVIGKSTPCYVSIFAGRIADTGRDPIPIMTQAIEKLRNNSAAEVIWASTRELFNIYQANEIGCHIITVTNDIINKIEMVGYDLDKYSLDTVKMFYKDAMAAGYKI